MSRRDIALEHIAIIHVFIEFRDEKESISIYIDQKKMVKDIKSINKMT